jgi:hypothetical protein
MKFFPIVFILAVVCLAVAAQVSCFDYFFVWVSISNLWRTPMYKTGSPWWNLQFPENPNQVDSEKNLAQSICHDDNDGQTNNCKIIDYTTN